jgi:phosphoribosylamine--glycine ligase
MPPVVLVIGKDARTDAIAAACALSPSRPVVDALTEIMIPGLHEKCRHVHLGQLTDVDRVLEVAQEVRPDIAIIGPEEPLAAGCVDALASLGIPAFGPTKRLAAIESSKSWARALLAKYDIPGNPEYRVFEQSDGLEAYMEELTTFVIKPDGLTAGKGVRVFGEHLHSLEDAMIYARDVLRGGPLLIEEKVNGEEFSLQTITDGDAVIHLPLVQDHKRAYDGDQGPNTGGMGSYSCSDFSLPFLTREDLMEARSINERVINALASDTGERYRGVLYGGFIATRDGLRLIEYNSRFGDPEAMNVLPLLRGDFVELCSAVAAGELGRVDYAFEPKATVCKYIVPKAYPAPSAHNGVIRLPSDWRESKNLHWYWAACRLVDQSIYLTASRSGAVVGIGASLQEAETLAERAAQQVQGNVRHREDIGTSELVNARIRHMRSLRGHAYEPHAELASQR